MRPLSPPTDDPEKNAGLRALAKRLLAADRHVRHKRWLMNTSGLVGFVQTDMKIQAKHRQAWQTLLEVLEKVNPLKFPG